MGELCKKELLACARKEINEVDAEMAKLFVRRMRAAEKVAEYKRANGLPVLDLAREEAVVAQNAELIGDEAIRPYYVEFIRGNMALSRAYQEQLIFRTGEKNKQD